MISNVIKKKLVHKSHYKLTTILKLICSNLLCIDNSFCGTNTILADMIDWRCGHETSNVKKRIFLKGLCEICWGCLRSPTFLLVQ
jgi:hypothetical protein